ncbi:vitamin B6 photo-protection and homoeostasis-domain-containing protein [Pelagophyceae sp. CCMP2097]|nr:vitamin B6 photo-protection and homoeostasis-domain-containing protein [Pelagophyceae sp. CCMP2097]
MALGADGFGPVRATSLSAARRRLRRSVRGVFVPERVNQEYFEYTRWRCVQRLLSATVNVFGIQAMIMAVGIKDRGAGGAIGAAAAIDWVLKDALGKVTRLVWAGRMSREFDGDAKRWRFRSSLLYATGNGLQIATFAFPHLFLVLATVANCLKQISLLTSTATRNAIYRSFAATEGATNMGDITAKGESQIAVVDLIGMFVGIVLSRVCGLGAVDRSRLVAAYTVFSLLEIGAMYNEIKCVVFRQLNLERAAILVDAFVSGDVLPSPREVSRAERILRPPRLLRSDLFCKLKEASRKQFPFAQLQAADLAAVLDTFAHERYLLVPVDVDAGPRKAPAVVLHRDATDADLLEALLARTLAQQALDEDAARAPLDAISMARASALERTDALYTAMREAGWSTRAFMFPDVPMRATWPRRPEPAPEVAANAVAAA